MNNKKYTYPIGSLFRFVILLEIIWWSVFGMVFIIVKWIDFKKEWAKKFIPTEAEETAKRIATEFLTAELTPSVLHPRYVWLLLVLPVIWFVEGKFMLWKNKRLGVFSDKTIQTLMISEVNTKALKWRYFWLRTALIFTIIALMQPVFGTRKTELNQRNQEIVLCLDISNSMNVKDLSVKDSRLDIAKRGIINYINTLRGERIGLCVFAGTAQIQLPITTDYHATKMFVNEIQTDIISQQGTNINDALLVSSKMFTKSKNSKITMIITDGEDHMGQLTEGVKAVREKNIKLAVYGIGSNKGGYVPNDPTKPEFGFKILPTGKRVVSKLNKKLLVEIAQLTNGSAIVINTNYPDFQSTVNRFLTNSENQKGIDNEIKVKQNFYPYFLGLAIILFSIYLFHPIYRLKINLNTLIMKFLFILICLLFVSNSFSQDWREELNLARKLYKTKQYYAAYNRYLKVNQIKPKNIDITTELAQASYKVGYANKSVDYYKKTLKTSPNNIPDLNYNLGNSYYKSNDYKKAVEAYKVALRKNPNDDQTRHNLTLALKKEKENKPKEQPKENQTPKNQSKPQPNTSKDNKKEQENPNQPDQSIQKEKTERMLDELMKDEMKAKQNAQNSNKSNKSNNNGKDW